MALNNEEQLLINVVKEKRNALMKELQTKYNLRVVMPIIHISVMTEKVLFEDRDIDEKEHFNVDEYVEEQNEDQHVGFDNPELQKVMSALELDNKKDSKESQEPVIVEEEQPKKKKKLLEIFGEK